MAKNSLKMTFEHNTIIRQILSNQLWCYSAYYVIEIRKQDENISCYILEIDSNNINEYRTSKKFFQSVFAKGLIKLAGTYGSDAKKIKHGLFTPIDNKQIPLIIEETLNKKKPTKKQIGIITKAYNKIIYQNARNSQFYIIPSIQERKRIKRYECVRKSTIDNLIKKGLIKKEINYQIYLISERAIMMLENKAQKELKDNMVSDMSIQKWIETPKLMQEYIIRITKKGEKK